MKSISEIKKWLDYVEVGDYRINNDFSVDCFSPVRIKNKFINELPIKFGAVKDIFELNSCGLNSMKNLPTSVERLVLINNKIKDISNIPNNCIALDLSNNEIRTLKNIKTKKLKYLNLRGNLISNTKDLPKSLTELILCSNNISKIKELPNKLEYLDLSNNNIEKIESIPKELKRLLLSNNKIKALENLPFGLEFIDLIENKIPYINGVNKNLKHIVVTRNPITEIRNVNQDIKIEVSKGLIRMVNVSPYLIKNIKIVYMFDSIEEYQIESLYRSFKTALNNSQYINREVVWFLESLEFKDYHIEDEYKKEIFKIVTRIEKDDEVLEKIELILDSEDDNKKRKI